MSEERVVNSKTGGEKGRKPEAMSLLPLDVLMRDVAPLYHAGVKKYAAHNWRRGFDWSLSADALLRHFSQFWHGQDRDEETGAKHLASVVFHACALMHFMEAFPELDDRPPVFEPEDPHADEIADAEAGHPGVPVEPAEPAHMTAIRSLCPVAGGYDCMSPDCMSPECSGGCAEGAM